MFTEIHQKATKRKVIAAIKPKHTRPKAYAVVASVLARWFDDIIQMRRVLPNNKGIYVFSLTHYEFLQNMPNNKDSPTIRKYLATYGYKLKKYRNEIIVYRIR